MADPSSEATSPIGVLQTKGSTINMTSVSPGPAFGIMSSIPKPPAAQRQKIMRTTVDVAIRCFFNPGCAESIMALASFESITRGDYTGLHPYNLQRSFPEAQK